MWKVIRYRRVQALVIAALAALITTSAVFAPLYDRDLQQALTSSRLEQVPVQVSGLSVISSGAQPLNLPSLDTEAPSGVRPFLDPPLSSTSVQISTSPRNQSAPVAPLFWGEKECAHVRFTAGRCPAAAREIAVSTADTAHYHWKVGMRLPVEEVANIVDAQGAQPKAVQATLTVVGVYSLVPGDYWFGKLITGRSGFPDPGNGQPQADYLLTDQATFNGAVKWADPSNEVDWALRDHAVGVDQLLRVGPEVQRLTDRAANYSSALGGASLNVFSGLPQIAIDVAHGRKQAQVIVPLLMVQLGLLAVVVLWLVLGAAIEQRRPEVALARLRGRGVNGARRLLLGELVPVVLVGVVVGGLLGIGLSYVVAHTVLPGRVPFEIGSGYALALLIALVSVLVLTLAAVRRVATEPVSALLRRVPARRMGWALGVLDAMVIAASAIAVFAFVSGGLKGPIALIAPSLLALMVGLVLAHLLVPVASGLGGRLLARGRVVAGVGLLQVARRPATRRVVALVTVATALLVFSFGALAVGARNRGYAAEQQVGAPYVLDLSVADVPKIRAVLHEVDPAARHVTPVVSVQPPGADGGTTVAVDPAAFRRIASFPGQDPDQIPWARLAPPSIAPLRIVGTSVSARVSSTNVELLSTQTVGADGEPLPLAKRPKALPGQLSLELVGSDDLSDSVQMAAINGGFTKPHQVTARVPCAQGCLVSGLAFDLAPESTSAGQVTIGSITTSSGQRLQLGPSTHWQSADDGNGESLAPVLPNGAGPLTVAFTSDGGNPVVMHHDAVPAVIPALVAGALPGDAKGNAFGGLGMDGVVRPMRRVAVLPRVPGAELPSQLVSLATLERDGANPDAQTTAALWFDGPDKALVARAVADLKKQGILVADSGSVPQVRHTFDQSAAAWGLELAAVVGTAGLLIAALVLIVVVATTWRLRSRDFAALRMSGLSPRTIASIATGEQLPVVALAVVVGAVCGVVGAQFALPKVPLFATPPAVSTLDLSPAWIAVLLAALAALVVLTAVGWLAGLALARRSSLERLRESL